MALVNIKINGQPFQVESGLTVLEAARKCGFEIPSLCAFNHGKCSLASCRVCLVEVVGARGLVASCVYPVNEGMEIITNSTKAVEARRASVELILSIMKKIVCNVLKMVIVNYYTLPKLLEQEIKNMLVK